MSTVLLTSRIHSTLLVLPALCLMACSEQDVESKAQISMYTGRLETADAVVGLAVSDSGDVDAYICGGATNFATISRWFGGALSSSAAILENDGFQLAVSARQGRASITLTTLDGTEHSADIDQAENGSRSALYESDTTNACRWGVITIDEGGAEPDIHGTWCNSSAAVYAQVTPVRPIDFSKDILPVLVTTPDGEERFDVHRATVSRTNP